jgi:hypothetical protein
MKRCPTCNTENEDSMRFCLQCGTPLPDAPMVVNLGGPSSQSGQGQTMETQVGSGSRGGFQSNFQNPPSFSNVPPAKPKSGKTFLIVGGIAALLLLIFTAGAAVIGYNWFIKPDVVDNKTPTPSTSPSSSASTSPSKSPTKSPTEEPTSTPRKKDSSMSASLNRMWIDYGETQGGQKGMLIHVSYKVSGMKGVESYLALYFEKKNGDKLKSDKVGFKSADGQLALYKEMEPGYDSAVYDDVKLFMPYDEIDLGSGKYDLTISADVIYKEGGLIDHLKDYPFVFEVK